MSGDDPLFSPLGSLGLRHRVVMPPLTRLRAGEDFVVSERMIKYYSDRANEGGLIIFEGCIISPQTPLKGAPGIFTMEHENKLKELVSAVHAKGCKISIQLWHLGRESDSGWEENEFIKGFGAKPCVSSSEVPAPFGSVRGVKGQLVEPSTPRSLTEEDLGRIEIDFKTAAQRAISAGFDFVEIHAAHGDLFEQFFSEFVNLRTDWYGGCVENNTRLFKSVFQSLYRVVGPKLAVRISPSTDLRGYSGCKISKEVHRDIVVFLSSFTIAYLLVSEPRYFGESMLKTTSTCSSAPESCFWIREIFKGVCIGCGGFSPASARKSIHDGHYDAIAFGRLFISNPDLVQRLRLGLGLSPWRKQFFYKGDDQGYNDYPPYISCDQSCLISADKYEVK